MTRRACVATVLASLASVAGAQGQTAEPSVKLQPGATAIPRECLTKEELELNRALQALRRPTRGVDHPDGDDQPRFNPHYFVGAWSIEGVLPESPVGPAGEFIGVETVRHVERCTYESSITGKVAGEPFTVRTLMYYDREAGYMVRLEQDSRGFQLLKSGVLGGDAGGYFTHHWDAPQFVYKGRHIWLRGTTFLASPENYRLRMQISDDGQRYVNFGTIWWSRREPEQP